MRFKQGSDVFARWKGVDMPEVACYRGSFADHFIPQLERLGVRVHRQPGVQPPLIDASCGAWLSASHTSDGLPLGLGEPD